MKDEKKANFIKIKKINPYIIEKQKCKSFSRQIISYLENNYNEKHDMIISNNSNSLSYIDELLENRILTIRTTTIAKLHKKHSLSYEFISQLETLFQESVLAFDSKEFQNSKIIVLDEKYKNAEQMIAILRTNKRLASIEVNEVTSVYNKKNFINYMESCFAKNKTFYCNKKTKHFIKSYAGFQLPKEITNAFLTVKYKGSFNKSQVENMLKIEKELEKLEKDLDIELESSVEKTKRKEKDKELDSKELEI